MRPITEMARVCLVATLLFLSLLAFGLVISIVTGEMPHAVPDQESAAFDPFQLIVLAPVSETFLWQFCIIEVAMLAGSTEFLAAGASALAFAAAHIVSLPAGAGFVPGILGGVFLGAIYVLRRRQSVFAAFAVTASVHAVSNAEVLLSIAGSSLNR